MEEPPKLEDIKHRFAGVFLITDTGRVIGQRRDDDPLIDNPGKIGSFGGTIKKGEEPQQAAWRELVLEETNLQVLQSELEPFHQDVSWRELTKEWQVRYFFVAMILESDLVELEVYEGEDWAYIEGPDDPELIDLWRPVVSKLFDGYKLSI
jgi:8-oxo-dGTP pyrophosphatase MutT (NUDIX family)